MSLKWRNVLTPLALPALMTGVSLGLMSLSAQPPAPAAARPVFVLASDTKETPKSDSSRGYLGVSCQRLSSNLREVLEIPRDLQGVLISDVVDGSPADHAGLRNRDIVLRMNGRDIDTERDLTTMIREAGAGTQVNLSVWRDGKTLDLTATLAAAPAGRRDYSWSWSSDDEDDEAEPRMKRRMRDLRGLEKLRELGDLQMFAPTPPTPPSPPDGGPFVFHLNSDRGRLGVQLQEMNDDIAAYFSAPNGKGALVWQVMDDSPAARAGLKAGDVIVEVEGDRVDDIQELHEALRGHDAGDKVAITVLRRGQSTALTATLDDGPVEFGATRIWRGEGGKGGPGFHWTPGPGREHEEGASLERVQRQMERLQLQLDALKQKLSKLKD